MRPRVRSAARRAVQRTRAARPRRHPLQPASLALMGLRLPSRRRARPSRPRRPCLRQASYWSEARHCAIARWHPRCRSQARPTRFFRHGSSLIPCQSAVTCTMFRKCEIERARARAPRGYIASCRLQPKPTIDVTRLPVLYPGSPHVSALTLQEPPQRLAEPPTAAATPSLMKPS